MDDKVIGNNNINSIGDKLLGIQTNIMHFLEKYSKQAPVLSNIINLLEKEDKQYLPRLRDNELRILLNLYDKILSNTIKCKNGKIKIKLFTYKDMCPLCWTIWKLCLPELQKLISGSNQKAQLDVEIYSMHTLNNVYPLKPSSTRDEAVFLDSVIYSAYTDKVRTLQALYYEDNNNNSNMTNFIPRRYHYYQDLSHSENYPNITMKQFVDWFGINCVTNNGPNMLTLQQGLTEYKNKMGTPEKFTQFSDSILAIYKYASQQDKSNDDMKSLYKALQSIIDKNNTNIVIQEIKFDNIVAQLQKVIDIFFAAKTKTIKTINCM